MSEKAARLPTKPPSSEETKISRKLKFSLKKKNIPKATTG